MASRAAVAAARAPAASAARPAVRSAAVDDLLDAIVKKKGACLLASARRT